MPTRSPAKGARPSKSLNAFKALRQQVYVKPADIAKVYIGLDERDKAFQWMEKGYEERDDDLPYLAVCPMDDRLRSDPRYSSLVKRIGLSP